MLFEFLKGLQSSILSSMSIRRRSYVTFRLYFYNRYNRELRILKWWLSLTIDTFKSRDQTFPVSASLSTSSLIPCHHYKRMNSRVSECVSFLYLYLCLFYKHFFIRIPNKLGTYHANFFLVTLIRKNYRKLVEKVRRILKGYSHDSRLATGRRFLC